MLAEGSGRAPSHRRLFVFFRLANADLTDDTVLALLPPGNGGTKTHLELEAERLVPLAGVARERGGCDDRGVFERLGVDRARHDAGRRRGDRHGRGDLVRRVRREDPGTRQVELDWLKLTAD